MLPEGLLYFIINTYFANQKLLLVLTYQELSFTTIREMLISQCVMHSSSSSSASITQWP